MRIIILFAAFGYRSICVAGGGSVKRHELMVRIENRKAREAVLMLSDSLNRLLHLLKSLVKLPDGLGCLVRIDT